jgi:glycosyltransferase involved in cell wall biosynthesis
MKKILIFSLAYFPKHIGGAEVAIKEITDRVPASEYEFHMVTNRFDSSLPKEEKIGNVTVHRIGLTAENPTMADLRKWPLHLNKFLYQFGAAWKALELHKKHGFDGAWAMMAHAAGVPASLFTLLYPKVKLVLTLQEGDPPEYIEKRMRILWPFFKRAFVSAEVVQPISNFLAAWARRMGAKGTIEVIPNGVDTARFSEGATPSDVTELQDELGKKMN